MIKRISLALIIGFMVASCDMAQIITGNPGDEVSNKSEASRPKVVYVVGLDRSGSYAIMDAAIEFCINLIERAGPGAEFIFRWISAASYNNRETISHFEVSLPENEDTVSPFDIRAHRAQQAKKDALEQEAREVIDREIAHLRSLAPKGAKQTDIYGFIAAAADIFSLADPEAIRKLYLATDLIDNVGYEIEADLTDVHVTCIALQNKNNPAEMKALRDKWRAFFNESGAAEVKFVAAEIRG